MRRSLVILVCLILFGFLPTVHAATINTIGAIINFSSPGVTGLQFVYGETPDLLSPLAQFTPVSTVPEPTSILLLAIGFGLIGVAAWLKKSLL